MNEIPNNTKYGQIKNSKKVPIEYSVSHIPLGPHVNTCIYTDKDYIRSMEKEQLVTLTPYDNFVYALKADETKRQYAQTQ
jgi:hypothetical protein